MAQGQEKKTQFITFSKKPLTKGDKNNEDEWIDPFRLVAAGLHCHRRYHRRTNDNNPQTRCCDTTRLETKKSTLTRFSCFCRRHLYFISLATYEITDDDNKALLSKILFLSLRTIIVN
jgi:hypothetical protein